MTIYVKSNNIAVLSDRSVAGKRLRMMHNHRRLGCICVGGKHIYVSAADPRLRCPDAVRVNNYFMKMAVVRLYETHYGCGVDIKVTPNFKDKSC